MYERNNEYLMCPRYKSVSYAPQKWPSPRLSLVMTTRISWTFEVLFVSPPLMWLCKWWHIWKHECNIPFSLKRILQTFKYGTCLTVRGSRTIVENYRFEIPWFFILIHGEYNSTWLVRIVSAQSIFSTIPWLHSA